MCLLYHHVDFNKMCMDEMTFYIFFLDKSNGYLVESMRCLYKHTADARAVGKSSGLRTPGDRFTKGLGATFWYTVYRDRSS